MKSVLHRVQRLTSIVLIIVFVAMGSTPPAQPIVIIVVVSARHFHLLLFEDLVRSVVVVSVDVSGHAHFPCRGWRRRLACRRLLRDRSDQLPLKPCRLGS